LAKPYCLLLKISQFGADFPQACVLPKLLYSQSERARFVSSVVLKLPRTRRQLLKDGGTLVLHVMPFAAFDFGQSLSLDQVSEHPERFAPIKGTARHRQVTFDGFLTASTAGDLSEPQRAYVQVFRTGIVEAVTSSIAEPEEPERGREKQHRTSMTAAKRETS
jgi:hypothetical protein